MIRFRSGLCGMALLAGSLSIATPDDAALPAAGEWSLNNWISGAGTVQLTLKQRSSGSRWQWSSTQPLVELRGLSREQLHAAHGDVRFTLPRDAGTFAFEGSVVLGLGRGTFQFTADPEFTGKLAALGYERVADADVLGMAIRDVSIAFAGEVKRAGLRDVTVRDLVRLRDHGVTIDFARELTTIAYPRLSADDVVSFADHAVPTDFLKTLKTSGYPELPARDIVKLRDHGVDSAYIEGLADTGYGTITPEEIILLRDHGVDAEYVARVRSAGFKDVSVDQIVKLHDHGVD